MTIATPPMMGIQMDERFPDLCVGGRRSEDSGGGLDSLSTGVSGSAVIDSEISGSGIICS
jgi:hypothetical protein